MLKKRIMMSHLLCVLCLAAHAQITDSASFESRKSEIQQRWHQLRPVFSGKIYDVAASAKPPFRAGKVNDAALKDGLNMVNFFRFLAGLPADVQLNAEYTEMAQHGSVLNAASGRIAHRQPKPARMSNDFYGKAEKGIRCSNLSYGRSTIRESVVGWMDDSDNSNIGMLGHRRWILNPDMLYTGFGLVSDFSSMYCFDESRTNHADYTYIAFPSGAAFPVDFFGTQWAWSVSLNPDLYQKPAKNAITVTLTETATGNKWNFGKGQNDGYFNIETSNFGIPICIIFRPRNIKNYTGAYSVTITGLKNKSGEFVDFSYETNFYKIGVED